MAKKDRGFASMDPARQREIASKGGKAAHKKGTAHEWTSKEARRAGRKGGKASHRSRKIAAGICPDCSTPKQQVKLGTNVDRCKTCSERANHETAQRLEELRQKYDRL